MKNLLGKLVNPDPYYVRIKPQLLSVKDTGSGEVYEDIPVLAISKDKKPSVLGVGTQAESEAMKSRQPYILANGFAHPRTIIADFIIAEKTLQYFIHQLAKAKLIRPSPIVIMHVLEKLEGGLTQVEIRALRELAAGAGAREVYIWCGPELQDFHFKSGKYPGDHWCSGAPQWLK